MGGEGGAATGEALGMGRGCWQTTNDATQCGMGHYKPDPCEHRSASPHSLDCRTRLFPSSNANVNPPRTHR